MRKILKIGIVGCGSIGSYIAKKVIDELSPKARISGIFDINPDKSKILASKLGNKKIICRSLKELITKSNLVIEAASAKSSADIAKAAILSGRDIFVMSVGGLLSRDDVFQLLKRKSTNLYIPSGAIAGLDAIKAAGSSTIKKVILTTRKPPKAFSGSVYVSQKNIDLEKIKGEMVLFEGGASEAIRLFPQNINVAAILKLATKKDVVVKIIASSEVSNNVHEIQVESDSGKIFSRTENLSFPENPKTSFLAALSAFTMLKEILEPVKIGS